MPRNPLSDFDKKLREEIASNLKKHTKGLTQADLSAMTGIPTSTLSGYFAKRSTINVGNTQKIADALGINKQDIDPRFKDNFQTASESHRENSLKTQESINQRIKKVRLNSNLTADEFAQKLNISLFELSTLELNDTLISSTIIEVICTRFNINKDWLKNGIGEMYQSIDKNGASLTEYVNGEVLESFDIEMLKLYFSLDVEMRAAVYNFLKMTLLTQKHNNTSSDSETSQKKSKTSTTIDDFEFATVEDAEEAYKKIRLSSASKTILSATTSINDRKNLKEVK